MTTTPAPVALPPGLPAGLPPDLTDVGRCLVMGVLNVTPDSFSDGGRWLDPDAAIAHGLAMRAEGADLVDVGGESTRPGAEPVSVQEEGRRVLPVVAALVAQGVPVSIDTMHALTAAQALEAGATLVNDVSGGLADPAMPALMAAAHVPVVAMHWRGPSRTMNQRAVYEDVLHEVAAELEERLEVLVGAGVDRERVVLDPGLGFAKTGEHNWQLLAGLGSVVGLGQPVLLGASRKRFLGSLLAGPDGRPAPVEQRDAATAATTVVAASAGAWCVRVHQVRPSADAVRVVAAVQAGASVWPA